MTTNVDAILTVSDPVAAASIQNRYSVFKHFKNAKKNSNQAVSFSCELQVYRRADQDERKMKTKVEVGSKWESEDLIVKLYPNAIKVLPPLPHSSKTDRNVKELEDPL